MEKHQLILAFEQGFDLTLNSLSKIQKLIFSKRNVENYIFESICGQLSDLLNIHCFWALSVFCYINFYGNTKKNKQI